MLGLHMRGTDRACHVEAQQLMPLIRAFLCRWPHARVFAATDDARMLERMQDLLLHDRSLHMWTANRTLMARDAVRGRSPNVGRSPNPGVHARSNTSFSHLGKFHRVPMLTDALAARLGEDALVDTLLLSQVDFAIGTAVSALTSYATLFNPRLETDSFIYDVIGHPLPSWTDACHRRQSIATVGLSHRNKMKPSRSMPTRSAGHKEEPAGRMLQSSSWSSAPHVTVDGSPRALSALSTPNALPLEMLPVGRCATLQDESAVNAPSTSLSTAEEALLNPTATGRPTAAVGCIRQHEFGFLSMLHVLVDSVSVAVADGFRPVISTPQKWRPPNECSHGLFCWLQPFGEVRYDGARCPRILPWPQDAGRRRAGFSEVSSHERLLRTATWVGRLLRPSASVSAQLTAERARLFPDGLRPFIGVHVRHGDSCTTAQQEQKKRECEGLEAFVPSIERLSRKYGLVDVFVASDGGDIVFNATQRFPQFRWHHLNTPKQHINIDRAMTKWRNFSMPHEAATSALLDTFLLSEAAALVGKMTSNVFRAAFELAVARHGGACVPPYISLDAPWCYRGRGSVARGRFAGESFEC